MISLKKVIRKLYHLIWFLSVFFIVSLPVNAAVNITPPMDRYATIFLDGHIQYFNNSSWVNDNAFWSPGYVPQIATPSSPSEPSSYAWLASGSSYCGTSGGNITGFMGSANGSFFTYLQKIEFHSDGGSSLCSFTNANNEGTLIQFSCVSSNLSNFSIHYKYKNAPGVMVGQYPILGRSMSVTCNSSDSSSAINNQTQQIIQNDNSNTQQIIENNNSNTDKQIDSQKVCKSVDKKDISIDGKFFNSSIGGTYNSPSYGISSYLNIYGATITIKNIFNYTNPSIYGCYYDTNKTLISCQKLNNISSLTIPSNAYYFRSSIDKNSNKPTYEICKNGNQALDDSVNDLNDNITDSNIDSSDDTINNLKDKIPTNSVISDLLLLPVRFLQNFVNALGSSCSQFNLGSLYGTNLYMPCINIENYLGSGIWTTIDLIISGLFVYSLRKKFIQIYQNLTNLKNGGNEVD